MESKGNGKENVEEERVDVTLIPVETFTTLSFGFVSKFKNRWREMEK